MIVGMPSGYPLRETVTEDISDRCLPSDHRAAVRMQHLPRHVAGILARQKHVAGSNLARLTRAAHGRVLSEALDALGGVRRSHERCPDGTWSNAVDANTT